ncbi:hypothetical protein GCM10008992_23380 [Halorubrum aquaticum]
MTGSGIRSNHALPVTPAAIVMRNLSVDVPRIGSTPDPDGSVRTALPIGCGATGEVREDGRSNRVRRHRASSVTASSVTVTT